MAKPWIAFLRVRVLIPGAASLKDRRSVVRSVLETIRARAHVSAADLGPQDVHDIAELAFVAVGSSQKETSDRMASVAGHIAHMEPEGAFESYVLENEVFCYDDL